MASKQKSAAESIRDTLDFLASAGQALCEVNYAQDGFDDQPIEGGDFVRHTKRPDAILGQVMWVDEDEEGGGGPLITVQTDAIGFAIAQEQGMIQSEKMEQQAGYDFYSFYAAPEEIQFETRDVHAHALELWKFGTRVRHNSQGEGPGYIKALRGWDTGIWGHMTRLYEVQWDHGGSDVYDVVYLTKLTKEEE